MKVRKILLLAVLGLAGWREVRERTVSLNSLLYIPT
jgi:hypothetical protein